MLYETLITFHRKANTSAYKINRAIALPENSSTIVRVWVTFALLKTDDIAGAHLDVEDEGGLVILFPEGGMVIFNLLIEPLGDYFLKFINASRLALLKVFLHIGAAQRSLIVGGNFYLLAFSLNGVHYTNYLNYRHIDNYGECNMLPSALIISD